MHSEYRNAGSGIEDSAAYTHRNPMIITLMGQIGAGKTSLINELFGTNLVVGADASSIKEMQKVIVKHKDGSEVWFWDSPGFGASSRMDWVYFTEYQRKMIESDVILWAIQADDRSARDDQLFFDQIVQAIDYQHYPFLLSKIIFVLTKADKIDATSWQRVDHVNPTHFLPPCQTAMMLHKKGNRFHQEFLSPYTSDIPANLFQQQSAIPCSTRLRFNLKPLLTAIMHRAKQNRNYLSRGQN